MRYRMLPSPVGALMLAGEDDALAFVGFSTGARAQVPKAEWERCDDAFDDAAIQLDEYFAGARHAFELALRPAGTPFQLAVLEALRSIPYGETRTYAQVAAAVGRPRAVRAVGAANARNPLPLVIPCHRVIGSNGSLTGFGGGMETKRFLLALEARAGTAA